MKVAFATFMLNYDIVGDTVKNDLPSLVKLLKEVI